MNAKRLFEDDELLFPVDEDGDDDRVSHVEIREADPSTEPEIQVAEDWLQRVPTLAVNERTLESIALDHREAFVLSRIDGFSTIETVLDLCAMPLEDALLILADLVERKIVVLR